VSGAELERIRARRGRAVVVRGNDIDTDVIMPARFLKSTTFAGLERGLFHDARFDAQGRSRGHPLDRPEFAGASMLVVNANFGCGSSREHAPQGLRRWGIRALIGESFSEIFFGNCVALGLPAVSAEPADVARLMDAVERDPGQEVSIDLEQMRAHSPATGAFAVRMPAGARARLLEGQWDAMRLLLSAGEQIHQTAERLPYIRGF
jgi:3-isopropylmalate/(R)-2-methylmalate dehydratase small subunit